MIALSTIEFYSTIRRKILSQLIMLLRKVGRDCFGSINALSGCCDSFKQIYQVEFLGASSLVDKFRKFTAKHANFGNNGIGRP